MTCMLVKAHDVVVDFLLFEQHPELLAVGAPGRAVAVERDARRLLLVENAFQRRAVRRALPFGSQREFLGDGRAGGYGLELVQQLRALGAEARRHAQAAQRGDAAHR